MTTDTTEGTTAPFEDVNAADITNYTKEEMPFDQGGTVGAESEQEERNTGDAPYWKVKGEKTFTPVKMKDDTWRCRVMWSDKLGLEHNHEYTHPGDIDTIAGHIHKKGWLEMKNWKKVFAPSDKFLTGEGFERDLVKF